MHGPLKLIVLTDDRTLPTAAEENKPKGPSLRANTAAQSLPILTGYVLSFVSAPIVVAGLGVTAFGVWSVTGAIAQYGALLDLGVARAVSRYVALYEAQQNRRAQGEVMTIALLALVGVAAVLCGIGAGLAAPASDALGVVGAGGMRIVILCSVGTLLATLIGRVIAAYAVGQQRMVAPNAALVVNAVITFAAVVAAIALRPTLEAFAVANLVASAIGVGVTYVVVSRAEGGIPFAWPSRAHAIEVVRFGSKAQVGFVSDLIVFQSDKIILGFLVGPGAAGAYELGSRVALAGRAVAVLALSALMPTLTSAASKLGVESVTPMYFRFTTRAAAFGFAPLILLAAGAPLFLTAWLGDIPKYTEPVVIVLALASASNVASGVSSLTAQAVGRPGIVARSGMVNAGLNVVLALVLAPLFGVWGVLAATGFAAASSGVLGVVLVQRSLGLSNRRYWHSVRGPLVASVMSAAPVLAVSLLYSPDGRPLAVAASLVVAGAFTLIYVSLSWRHDLLPRPARMAQTRSVDTPGSSL